MNDSESDENPLLSDSLTFQGFRTVGVDNRINVPSDASLNPGSQVAVYELPDGGLVVVPSGSLRVSGEYESLRGLL